MKTCNRQWTPVALLAVISIAACETASAADAWVVTSTADDGGPDTLRYAINSAQDGDTIVFDESLNNQTITLNGSELFIAQRLNPPPTEVLHLTIIGPGPDKLAISAGYASRVFEVLSGAQVTISGLSIVQGLEWGSWEEPYAYGGAIYNDGNLTLNNCLVAKSGWWADGPIAYVTNYGGGICNDGMMTIDDCIVTNNAVHGYGPSNSEGWGAGGGIANYGTMEINRSSVFDNYREDSKTGVVANNNVVNYGTLKVHRSKIQKNDK